MRYIFSKKEASELGISLRGEIDASAPLSAYTSDDLARVLPKRYDRSNKGSYGRALIIAGSRGMAGAAYLAAKAAYRSGVGLVEIFTHEANRTALQTMIPEAIITPYEYTDGALLLLPSSLKKADAVLIGCGISTDNVAKDILRATLIGAKSPLVIDADALNLISADSALRALVPNGAILTPHAAEASRLTEMSISEILDATVDTAALISRELDCVCLLKDHRTVICADGSPSFVNLSGNSGMSTAGSGDVLAGIIVSLAAQSKRAGEIFGSSLSATDVAALGAFLHGCAGDVARDKLGERSLMAGDIIDALPEVLKEV